ncbi:MAG: nitroreductase [Desulfobacteraceae bacterium]|nr:MAG: nitroreductase [Desulfobacteraceae bacterium]
MDVIETMQQRRSTRAFLDKPVEREILERLLTIAGNAPSAINMQPWEIAVVSGAEKKRLSRILVKRMRERSISCGPGATKPLHPRFVSRQRELLNCILPHLPAGIRFEEFINEGSCNFYGAPVAVIITLDRAFSGARFTDLGIVTGYLVLAAHEMGLGTCPIGLITAFEEEIIEELSLSEEKQVVIGIALGYPDPESPLNKARSSRADLNEVVKWRE